MDTKSADMVSSANNSSDFVRKLYKMLEDPAYDKIVRWGEGGQSFVVLENEKFTKSILPKHFKHSNFASFVRQLNKYDFHKVRQNNEDSIPSQYGPNAWEFKHPEFQANKKDSLDNIRRKAPVTKKNAQNSDEPYPAQQMDLVNSQLVATQQQLQMVTDRYNELSQGHTFLLQQVVNLQKFVKNQDSVMRSVVGFLQDSEARKRSGRVGYAGPGGPEILDDRPPSPLQQAAKMLQNFSGQSLSTAELEQKVHEFQSMGDYSTPPQDSASAGMQASEGAAQMGYHMYNDLDSLVYPVGHTNGIDPINREHIHNIPYAFPQPRVLPIDTMSEMGDTVTRPDRKKSVVESVWGPQKPQILLVEDDPVCAKVGRRFLQSFECGVDIAVDGLDAVEKYLEDRDRYDLILMDIIMPRLDGVSAAVSLRRHQAILPIIAMTSNIRTTDMDMYFRFGMNDVLPKPFTKEGMIRALEKYLPAFRKNAQPLPPQLSMQNHSGIVTPNGTQAPLGLNIGQISSGASAKDEASPGRSPITIGSWNSPNQIPGQSPSGNPNGGYMPQPMAAPSPYGMSPMHSHHLPQTPTAYQKPPPTPVAASPQTHGHRRVMSDMTGGSPQDDRPDKRQRVYGASPGGYQ